MFDSNPGVDTIIVEGPFQAVGPSDTASRRRIFSCQPRGNDGEACAKTILSTIAHRAYRRPLNEQDLAALLEFYRSGNQDGGFEGGVQSALERILVSPDFLFRIEQQPSSVPTNGVYRLSDVELASRLSFFLWSSMPDDELLATAERGKLKDPATLDRQVRRMLADPRAKALVD